MASQLKKKKKGTENKRRECFSCPWALGFLPSVWPSRNLKARSQFLQLWTPLTAANSSTAWNPLHLQKAPIAWGWTSPSRSLLPKAGAKPFLGAGSCTGQPLCLLQWNTSDISLAQPLQPSAMQHPIKRHHCSLEESKSSWLFCSHSWQTKWLCGIPFMGWKKIACDYLTFQKRRSMWVAVFLLHI